MINPVEFNDHIIRIAIQEDFNQQGDITSRATCKQNQYGQARIIAKAEGIIAGLSVAQKVFYTINKNIRFDAQKTDGDEVKSGDVIVLLDGPVSDMLSAERVALNFLGRLSGIATMTSHFVAAVQGLDVKILDTRKTTPGLRGLEKYAVRVGGGTNHRFGLFDMFLIKENHILAAGGINTAGVL